MAPVGVITIEDDVAKGPVCGCLGLLRARLRETNGTPGVHRVTGGAFIYVRRVDPGLPPPPFVTATYCPFCGEAYQ